MVLELWNGECLQSLDGFFFCFFFFDHPANEILVLGPGIKPEP